MSSVDNASQALDRLEMGRVWLSPEEAAAVATVRQELQRLREELDEYAERLAWHREERGAYLKGNLWVTRAAEEQSRAEAAEAENRRLTEGLREKDEIIDCLLQRGYFDPFVPLAAFRKIVPKGAYSVTTADEERAWRTKIEARALLSASPTDGGGA